MIELIKVGHCWHPEAVVLGFGSLKKMCFPAYVGLIRHPTKGVVLFDTGYAKRFLDETNRFPERAYRMVTPIELGSKEALIDQLESFGVHPSEVNYIFISHFHADHISGLLDFPKAKFICSKLGYDEIMSRGRFRGVMKGYLKGLVPEDFNKRCEFIEDLSVTNVENFLAPFVQGADIFGDGSLIAINLPGHAVGQYGLYCAGSRTGVFLIGDAAWTKDAYENKMYPLRLAFLVMDSRKAYISTLEKLNELRRRDSAITILPSHCEQSYLEYCGDQ